MHNISYLQILKKFFVIFLLTLLCDYSVARQTSVHSLHFIHKQQKTILNPYFKTLFIMFEAGVNKIFCYPSERRRRLPSMIFSAAVKTNNGEQCAEKALNETQVLWAYTSVL